MPLLDEIFTRTPPLGKKRDLAALQRLLPQLDYPCIHIAGSNGKGSVATKVAACLMKQGKRVGLYTSPHLFSFCERIQIGFEMIAEERAEKGVRELLAHSPDLTFFEIATLLAFSYFQEQHVDMAVIETGLGGRWDATNIIHPILTVITSISKEHSQLLGEDLETIAYEKAGIFKPGIPVVLGPKARQNTFYEQAQRLDCPIHEVPESPLFYEEENCAIARKCLELLGLSDQEMEAAIHIRPPCRFERQGRVIYDVAHNPDAFSRLVQAISSLTPPRKARYVVGLCRDKELDASLRILAKSASHFHFVQSPSSRACPISTLSAALEKISPISYTCHEEIGQGVQEALSRAEQADEWLIVTGTFYIMQEAMRSLPGSFHAHARS